ncbi:MAG: hypothetical protein HN704_05380 [Bacteroidetes bacterium]|jgi:hypothetical protein|nr:hypothetical protein [Bacteroidota bacterium]MBT6685674.1 hypothetical protein [Bacteroidota bacterium]MBT7141898.1 hypothetical protein [Bacteroidota bacterium]MBT7491025.1 hypothetical protein [Bacteroidota bacterium]
MENNHDKQKSTLSLMDNEQMVDVFDNPEPWSKIETKLVVYSFIAAIISLVVFGFFVNKYLLNAI